MNNKVLVVRSTSIYKDSRTTKLVAELLNLGYDVDVLGWDRLNEYSEEELLIVGDRSAKIKFFKKNCPYGRGIKNIRNFIGFQKWIKKQIKEYDVTAIIHACDFDTAMPAFKACGSRKFIYDIFDYFSESRKMPKLMKFFVQRCENKIINNADATIICTEQRKSQIHECTPRNLTIIHNTPEVKDVSDFNLRTNNCSEIKVAYVGVLADNRLLKEILEESKNHKNIEFHIGGIGELSDYVKELEKLQENIFYYGSMKYSDVLALENKCDVLFATYNPDIKNHKFSAPNKFYEAGALSKPIIVCDGTGVDELVSQYNTGLIIKYNADAFYGALNKLINDKTLQKNLAENGRVAYLSNFSWDIMKSRIKGLYENILGK